MITRQEIESILRQNDHNRLEEAVKAHPKTIRLLMGFLYHQEEGLRDAAAQGFGIAARILPLEKLKDLIRRMMWMLNDESGSCSWHVPYALGEIGYNNPEAIKDFVGCLSHYADDPDEYLRTGVRSALKRIKETGRDFKDEGYVVIRSARKRK
ncbi:DVU0298 family protein [candidate division KSB1 bacterium]